MVTKRGSKVFIHYDSSAQGPLREYSAILVTQDWQRKVHVQLQVDLLGAHNAVFGLTKVLDTLK